MKKTILATLLALAGIAHADVVPVATGPNWTATMDTSMTRESPKGFMSVWLAFDFKRPEMGLDGKTFSSEMVRVRIDCAGKAIADVAHIKNDNKGKIVSFDEKQYLDVADWIPLEQGSWMIPVHESVCKK